jgi:hypothetical protein
MGLFIFIKNIFAINIHLIVNNYLIIFLRDNLVNYCSLNMGDKMKITKGFRKTIILSTTLILVLIMWYYFINPASYLKGGEVNEIGIYAILSRPLWDYGYNPDNFDSANPKFGDFQYNSILNGDALNKVIESLKYPSKSHYILPNNQEDYQGIYMIKIPITDDEGFMFITKDLQKEPKGKFIGYKYKGKENGIKRWIEYNNPKLGQTLMELRTK